MLERQQSVEWSLGHTDQFTSLMVFFSTATQYAVVKGLLAAMIAVMIVRGGRPRTAAIIAVLAFLLANETTDVIKGLWPANRPHQDGLIGLSDLVGRSDNPGTASAHSANMAAVAFAFTYYLGRWGWPWIAIALLTGYSRIYLNAHYPWQVFLGWSCGIAAAFVAAQTWEAWKRWKGRREVEDGEQEEELPTSV